MRYTIVLSLLFACLCSSLLLMPSHAQSPGEAALAHAVERAGDNRPALEQAMSLVASEQREGMLFLLENMPKTDLQTLDADFLLEHVRLAYEARENSSWGKKIPDEIFLNDVLPYANVNEKRDNVRAELRDRFWTQVKESPTISLAAAKLNQLVFQQLNVRYSTKRRRADQGPRESIDSGLASCTGLSILLIDACRACGIPARFVGTPLWTDGSGNHSWVEIWDNGWHFTGAAEPTGDQLDQAWFTERAAGAEAGTRHGIFAVSFRRTDQRFPLPWLDGTQEIWAIEVTDRYAKPRKVVPGMLSLQIRTLQAGSRDRCQANLIIRNAAHEVVYRGQTKDEKFDANDHLTVQLPAGEYAVELRTEDGVIIHQVTVEQDGKLVSLVAPEAQDESETTSPSTPDTSAEQETGTEPLDPVEALEAYLARHSSLTPEQLLNVRDEPFAEIALTREQADQVADRLTRFYRQRLLETRADEHRAMRIEIDGVVLKYDVKRFGEKPEKGHCLVISMHGGGGAPARVNDRQWENQKRLYSLEEGIYVAPRGPTDTWNLWHQAHIDPLFTRLIANMLAFEGVDPNRVYLTGYSAGGDGVYQLAPRMSDQLAAAAMMAGHPNETQPLGLRNLPYTMHVGGNDSAYNRNTIAREWLEKLAQLRRDDPGGYVHWAKVHEGKGHWMDGDDSEGVHWMLQYHRQLQPKRVVWLQDDVLHDRFYWLAVDRQRTKAGQKIIANRSGQRIAIDHCDVESLQLLLNDALVDLDEPIVVEMLGKPVWEGHVARSARTMVETLVDRGDPQAMYTSRLSIELSATP